MLKNLWGHFSTRRKNQFIILQIFIIVGSFFEMLSLGAVVPFLSVLANPESIFNSHYMIPIIEVFEIREASQLALPLTITFVALIMLSALVRIVLLWSMTRLSYTTGADLCMNMYRKTLYQDYAVHISRNSSEVINGIITKTKTVTSGVIYPLLNLISSVVTGAGIVSILLLVNVSVTLSALVGFGGLYLAVMLVTRRFLDANSLLIAQKSDLMVKSLQEGLEGIREVLINDNQDFYTHLYQKADITMRQASWRNDIIIASPRLGMEAVGIALVALFAQAATLNTGGLDQFLPQLGAFVLGAQKLLPTLQKGYGSYSRIKGSKYSLGDVIELLDQPIPDCENRSKLPSIAFSKCIELEDVSFRYSEQSPWILKNLSLKVPKGSVVGIVGTTGCGKSTLADILMGLLTATEGSLKIDRHTIDANNKRLWQQHIASVPQNIYLSDATLEENIAFGLPKEQIESSRVRRAAELAQLDDLIESCEGGYQALVGERGVKLSGGQRQRVGIARAFYKQSSVLFFDEATSALDEKTEQAVMSAIEGLKQDITVIIIAHRLTTLKNCDQILRFKGDYAVELIKYDDLLK